MKTKVETLDDFMNDLSEDSANLIYREAVFNYKGQNIYLDFITKKDKLYLDKIFKEIEEDSNTKTDFNQLKKEAEQEFLEVQKQIAKIQAKKNITVKEYTELYGDSKTTQQNYRGRLYDPLPFHQKVQGGKILYVVEEIERWRENQHK